MTLSDLVGEHLLDAVDRSSESIRLYDEHFEDCEVFRFRLDGKTYSAIEDPDDGYRSCMKELRVSDEPISNSFVPIRVLGRMSKPKYQEDETLELLDLANGLVILRVGTDNTNDYYPWFVSQWTPENIAANKEDQP